MAMQHTTTTTTFVRYTSTTTEDPFQKTGLPSNFNFESLNDDSDIGDKRFGRNNCGNGSAIDKLPLPEWVKSLLKGMLGDTGGNSLPSSSDAARTIRDFQKQNDIGLLSSDQVKLMADTGYCTMPNGERKLVPEDVKAAAMKMMDNNGELFKKLETAIRANHDGLLSAADYDAALKDGSIGKPGTNDLPTKQGLDSSAFFKFVMDGTISSNRPTEYNAAKTIHDFQKQHNIGLMSSDQVKQMADTGYCTLPGGKTIQVPPDAQAAAQKMMDNNGELYKKLETAIRANHDGLLSTNDFDAALEDGRIGKPGTNDFSADDADMIQDFQQQFIKDLMSRINLPTNDATNDLPSSADAAKTIQTFQQENKIGLMSIDQVKQMADPGYCTMPNGERKLVPPDIRAAAQKMMENNGELFKSVETSIRANHDGLLSAADYDAALKDGRIGKPGTNDFSTDDADMIQDFQQQFIKDLMNRINLPTNDATNDLPSSADAAKTIQTFQQENKIGLMSIDQVKQIADTGYCTMPNGERKLVPPDVKDAAMKMMENNGELFKSVETSIRANHDGLLSAADYDAALKDGRIGKPSTTEPTNLAGDTSGTQNTNSPQMPQITAVTTMEAFQGNTLGGEDLSRAQFQQIAETGKLTRKDGTTIDVSQEVRDAAKTFMANNGAMFEKLEVARNGKDDAIIGVKDYSPGWRVVARESLEAMKDFMKTNLGGAHLTRAQTQEMAETGKLTKNDGTVIDVPPQVRDAAQNLMANQAWMFEDTEARRNGKNDDILSIADIEGKIKDHKSKQSEHRDHHRG